MESEWDQLQSDASNAMGLYKFIICAYPYSRAYAYSILGIFPGYEILPKLNLSNSCFQDLSEVSQKHPHLLAPERGQFGPVLISTKHLLIIDDQFQLLLIIGLN